MKEKRNNEKNKQIVILIRKIMYWINLSLDVDWINKKNKQIVILKIMVCTKLRLWYHVR